MSLGVSKAAESLNSPGISQENRLCGGEEARVQKARLFNTFWPTISGRDMLIGGLTSIWMDSLLFN
jgi:hypothetical protein